MQEPYTHETNWSGIIGTILLVLGVLALLAGVIYLALPAHSLPSFMGQLPTHVHRSKRGIASLVVGAILAIVGGLLVVRSRRAVA